LPNSSLKAGDANLELPPPETKAWSSRRKAAVVVARRAGAISRTEACRRYVLSHEELALWEVGVRQTGISRLRSGNLYLYRPGPKPETASAPVSESRSPLQGLSASPADSEDRNADTRQTGTVLAGNL